VHVSSRQSAVTHELATLGVNSAVGNGLNGGSQGLVGSRDHVASFYNELAFDSTALPSETLWSAMLVEYAGGALRFSHEQLRCRGRQCDEAGGVTHVNLDGIGSMGIRKHHLLDEYTLGALAGHAARSGLAQSDTEVVEVEGEAAEDTAAREAALQQSLGKPTGWWCLVGMLVDKTRALPREVRPASVAGRLTAGGPSTFRSLLGFVCRAVERIEGDEA